MKKIVHIKHISEVHQFYGFEKPKHPLVSVLPIDERMTKVTYGNNKYIFDFYQISLKEGVSGQFTYGRNSYDFQEGSMTFLKPNQVIELDDKANFEGASGWTLIFHPDLLVKSELGKTIENYSFFDYGSNEALHVSDDEKQSLSGLTIKIQNEYNQNIDKHSQDLIIGNIEMLIKYSKRFYDRQFYTRTNLNQDVLSKFDTVLKNYYSSEKPTEIGVLTVGYCAKKLAMSSNYLGDLLKAETGRSAKDHIQNYVLERAKIKILGSSDLINEIAYQLGFEYPQSFTKMFKAKTGYTPNQFRNLN